MLIVVIGIFVLVLDMVIVVVGIKVVIFSMVVGMMTGIGVRQNGILV